MYNESVRSFNATDDFNPFHDQKKWNRIQGNPFGMPIVLGFQLEALVEYPVALLSCALLENPRQDNYAFETTRLCTPVTLFPWTGDCCKH